MYTMKKFSKFHLTALTLAGLMVVTTASVGAASVYKNITARQNTAMTVKVDGTALTMKDDDGDSLYPLTYDGNTYLPAEQLASAVGYNATSDDDGVSLTKKAAATSTRTSSTDIGAEKAKTIALNHAGVSASNAVFLHAKLDYDDGRRTYEVEFYSGSKEYDYEIDAATGEILSYDFDAERYTPSTSSGSSGTYISEAQAKQIVEQRAGTTGTYREFKLERDDGRTVYEGELRSGQTEYDFTIDATTGAILEWEVDR